MSLSPIIGATPRDVTQCLSVVFLLNGIALLVLPRWGRWRASASASSGSGWRWRYTIPVRFLAPRRLRRSGACAGHHCQLGRTLWLIPVVLIGALIAGQHDRSRPRLPLFIVLFVAASIASSWWGPGAATLQWVKAFSQSLLVTALFFIGLQMTRRTIGDLGGGQSSWRLCCG